MTAPPNEIERVAAAALAQLPALVEAWFPAGKWRGREYVLGDLDGGDGDSLSINTQTGAWCDFATKESGGDAVSLYAAMRRIGGDHPQLDAARQLADELGIGAGDAPRVNGTPRVERKAARQDKPAAVPVAPVPADAPPPPDDFNRKTKDGAWERLTVGYRWEYRDADGRLLGYVCRFATADGGKEVVPQTYCRHDDGEHKWRWLSFAKPRPLYGLDRLAAHAKAQVVVVEGEKAADAGQRLIGSERVVVVSWPGGGKAVQHVDWSPLKGRKVVLWPDNDEAGFDTMDGRVDARGRVRKGIAQLLDGVADGVRVVDPPADVADGWDLADAERDGWTADDVLGWIRKHVREARARGDVESPAEPPMVEDGDGIAHDDDDATVARYLAAYSDDALATAFSSRHRDELRFTPERGWLRFDGRRWAAVPDVAVMQAAREVGRDAARAAAADPMLNPGASDRIARHVSSAKTAAAIVSLARGAPEHLVAIADFDADPWLLNCPGGTVELRTGTLREHRREDLLTKLAGATPRGGSARWESFLHRIMAGDAERTAYLHRLAGYAAVADASEESVDFLYGPGGNGKGTYIGTVTAALGDYATTAGADMLMASNSDRHPTELARLAGARLVVAQEVDESRRWDETKLKMLTGRDVIAARYMRRDLFEFQPCFTLIIAGNHRPGLRTVDDAIRRRLHLVPFDVTIPKGERDLELKDALLKDLDGVMAWIVAGCMEWQRHRLSPPESVLAATAEYLDAEDSFGEWLTECVVEGSSHEELSSALHKSYERWKRERGEGVPGQRRFSGALVDRGFRRSHTRAGSVFHGLRLNDIERSRITACAASEYRDRKGGDRW